jgi:hypothetical protein
MRNSDDRPADHDRAATRYYQKDGAWFYATREGEHGPYPTRESAAEDARRYVGLHSHLETTRAERGKGQS